MTNQRSWLADRSWNTWIGNHHRSRLFEYVLIKNIDYQRSCWWVKSVIKEFGLYDFIEWFHWFWALTNEMKDRHLMILDIKIEKKLAVFFFLQGESLIVRVLEVDLPNVKYINQRACWLGEIIINWMVDSIINLNCCLSKTALMILGTKSNEYIQYQEELYIKSKRMFLISDKKKTKITNQRNTTNWQSSTKLYGLFQTSTHWLSKTLINENTYQRNWLVISGTADCWLWSCWFKMLTQISLNLYSVIFKNTRKIFKEQHQWRSIFQFLN